MYCENLRTFLTHKYQAALVLGEWKGALCTAGIYIWYASFVNCFEIGLIQRNSGYRWIYTIFLLVATLMTSEDHYLLIFLVRKLMYIGIQ